MTRKLSTFAAVAAVAGAAALASLPAQAGNVSWGVSIGVPGFAIFAGQPTYGWGAAPVVRPVAPVFVPRPVLVAPPVVYRPVVRPWVRPVPVYRPHPRVVYRHW